MTLTCLNFVPRIERWTEELEQETEEIVEMTDSMIGIAMDDRMIGDGMMDSDVAPTTESESLKMLRSLLLLKKKQRLLQSR